VERTRNSPSSGLASALLVSFAWAAIDAARLHGEFPFVPMFVALLGSASLLLGLLVVATERALPLGAVARAFVSGALLAALPLTAIAAVLEKVTHHRALGGVTFAFVAFFVVLASVACAGRLGQLAGSGGRRAALARGVLFAAVGLSCSGVLVAVAIGLRAPAAAPFVTVVVDAALGVVSWALALGLSLRLLRGTTFRLGAVLWIGAVVAGIFVAAWAAPLRHVLSERAPIAFAIGWVFGA
jgi:hypothetical protein